jgi:hypothetical protein
MSKIFPRNLTARAAYRVVGNPVSTRLESGVGNCFPGLEFDHRNLDRRFLPGVVVEFNSTNDSPPSEVALRGARLIELDPQDPGLLGTSSASVAEQAALGELRRRIAALDVDPATQAWFIAAITQGGVRIEMEGPSAGGAVLPFDGLTVWRLVRCLEPGTVDVELRARAMPDGAPIPEPVVLRGWRRRYTDPSTGSCRPATRRAS